ncbi:MAG TPA: phage holin family protein [Anaerolineaceae bacterium]|nr:phage holin family protein [Anaerolineaceae bacterium]
MKHFIIRLIINAIALYVAVALLNGRGLTPQSSNWLSFVWLALIFGVVNAILKPILKVLSCPILILTLGLGSLLINTLLFYLAGVIGTKFGVGFTVDGFWTAFLGALIVSIVSFILNTLLREEMRK